MLFESVTLHRRFPYAVLFGMFFLDAGAKTDGTNKRESTFQNAHEHFALFSGRDDPADRDEQYERLYIVLINTDGDNPTVAIFQVGEPDRVVSLSLVIQQALVMIARRNPDFYRVVGGRLRPRRGGAARPEAEE